MYQPARYQKFETHIVDEEDERVISIPCPSCQSKNTVCCGQDDARGIAQCWACAALFSYREYYEETGA